MKNASMRVMWAGRVGGVLMALVVYWGTGLTAGNLSPAGRATAAIATLMAIWWMTEALPLPATSLLPLILFPLAGVLPIDRAAAPYADRNVFLFMGGFMIANAVERWNLHRRIALLTVLAVGTRPKRLIGGVMLATAALSMWISNTATAAMMLPIGLSLVHLLQERLRATAEDGSRKEESNTAAFATCLMLGIAYAASIGGLGTLIGTPTNLVLAGFADENGFQIGFAQWMGFASPLAAVFLVTAWFLLTRFVFPIRIREVPGGRDLIRAELEKLGRVSRGEWTVLCVFTLTATAWVVRQPLTQWQWLLDRVPAVGRLDDTIIAMIGTVLLFLVPVDFSRGIFALEWSDARKLPWGVLLLFGGGFSLAAAMASSGLAEWIGQKVEVFRSVPTLPLVMIVIAMIIFLTELTSNTPTAATFIPILYGVAQGIHAEPLLFLAPATLAASCAFMLPVATPPNAIVFGSGYVSVQSMVRAGVWLNVAGILLITILMYTLGAWIFGLSF